MKKNKRNQTKRPNRRRTNGAIRTTPSIPRNLRGNSPFPESRTLRLTSTLTFVMQGASPFLERDYRINSLFNFNFTGATTNDFSGASQLAAIYNIYHVERIQVSFLLSGNETGQPVFFGLTFKDEQPSTTITTLAHAVNALEVSPTTGPCIVGQTSGMAIYRSRVYSIALGSVVGNTLSYMSDVAYTGAFGADPLQLVWMGAVAYSVGGNLTNGVIVNLRSVLTVRAFSIKTLLE